MASLSPEKRTVAIEAMKAYLSPDGASERKRHTDRDVARVELIQSELGPLVTSYLGGMTTLDDFKSRIDGINKRHTHWGFRGIKGQMFFNMVVNTAVSPESCDQALKTAMTLPQSEDEAKAKIQKFAAYAKQLGDHHVEGGGGGHGRPKIGSVPFFLSYFWQIQNRQQWPVYYTNGVRTMESLNLWRPTGELGDDYVMYKRIHEELATLFTKESGQNFGLYDVEHVFWFNGSNPYVPTTSPENPPRLVAESRTRVDVIETPQRTSSPIPNRLPDSYVPPIVEVLPSMARNDPALADAAKAAGTTLERAFEKHVNAAFSILGYEAKLLGQGQGRVPDGRALAVESSYAIIWDAKVRTAGYTIGTDDRTIREYIKGQSRELKKSRAMQNIYYVIISSGFDEDVDDAVRDLKMETGVSELCLVEAEALVAMVNQKLRDPLEVTLGPEGLQRLFASSGVLRAAEVDELFA